MEETEKLALKHALLNAIQHGGKCNPSSVLGKVLAENSELRKVVKEILPIVKKVCERVNSIPIEEQRRMLSELGFSESTERKERAEKDVALPPLPNAEVGKVVLRFAPFPSGPLHLGNARACILNHEYAKLYKGKLYLVFDDTVGSEEKQILPEAYDLILESLEWLGIKFDKVFYKSDRMELYYAFAEKLIKSSLAYVCECDAEKLRKLRALGKECEHRSRSVEENLEGWKKMLSNHYREGEAVLRLKTDMRHPNPAFRDRVLFRIVEREHPRVGSKYIVWPLLEATWAYDDVDLGITHVIRGKDLIIEDEVEKFIWERLGIRRVPAFVHYGLLSIKEAKMSKSEARKAIEEGKLKGWDDPRTWSLQSLRKRGILAEAVRRFILKMGLSEADVEVPAEILYAENRKLVDAMANRFFAVLNPVEVEVEGFPSEIEEAEIPLHPDFPERGRRKLKLGKPLKIFVEKEDLERLGGREIALVYLCTVTLGKRSVFKSREIDLKSKKIQWLPEGFTDVAKLIMPNGEEKGILVEKTVKEFVKEGDIVQLIRIGFCRVNKLSPLELCFAHK